MLSDRGVNFISKVVSALSALFEAKRLRASSFHPQTNSIFLATELHISSMVTAYCHDNQTQWNDSLSSVIM